MNTAIGNPTNIDDPGRDVGRTHKGIVEHCGDVAEGRSRPLSAAGGCRPGVDAGYAVRNDIFLGNLGCHARSRASSCIKPRCRKPVNGLDTDPNRATPRPGVNAGPTSRLRRRTPVNGCNVPTGPNIRHRAVVRRTSVDGRSVPSWTVPLLIALIVTVWCHSPTFADEPRPATKSGDAKKWHWPKVTISKETTHFTEPLRPDGGVDYIAAFNKKYSKGVTPENNAVVAIWQAAGPKELDKTIRRRYFRMLGIAELPEKGEYLAYYEDFPEFKALQKQPDREAAFHQRVWEQHSAAATAPWSKEDYPLWAAVLERNEKPLKILTEGLQRPRFYSPLIVMREDYTMLIGCNPIIAVNEARTVARLLPVRAMLRLHDGDVSASWQDIMTLYRLGRLGSQQPSYTNYMVSDTFDAIASRAAVVLSQYKGLTVAQARECQRQLRGLPAMRLLGEIFGGWERCSALECLTLLADADGAKQYFEIDAIVDQMLCRMDPQRTSGESERKRRQEAFKRLVARNDVDWSEVFRQHNIFWDRLTSAYNGSTNSKAMDILKSETIAQVKQAIDLVLSDKQDAVKNMDPKVKAQHIARLAVRPGQWWLWETSADIERRNQARQRMALLAFALAGYRAEHDKKYPKSLAEVAPQYIDAIPKDPYADGEFHYKLDDDGYLLYSVGANGRDDGGIGRQNMPESATPEQRQAWDDLSIRTPKK
jgi:hypothetical protein